MTDLMLKEPEKARIELLQNKKLDLLGVKITFTK